MRSNFIQSRCAGIQVQMRCQCFWFGVNRTICVQTVVSVDGSSWLPASSRLINNCWRTTPNRSGRESATCKSTCKPHSLIQPHFFCEFHHPWPHPHILPCEVIVGENTSEFIRLSLYLGNCVRGEAAVLLWDCGVLRRSRYDAAVGKLTKNLSYSWRWTTPAMKTNPKRKR